MLFRALGSLIVSSLLLAQNNPSSQAAPPAPADEGREGPKRSPSQQPPIRVQVNEVIVPVTVTDDKGKFVSNLDVADFKVYEDGKEQQIRFFTRERSQPVVVGFLIDQSNAMKLHWKAYLQDAAQELVLALLPGDPKYSGYLISYANDAELAVNTTSDSEKIVDKIRKMKPGGGSALVRRHLHGLHQPGARQGRADRAAARGDHHRRRPRQREQAHARPGHRTRTAQPGDHLCREHGRIWLFGRGRSGLKRLAEETGGRVVHPLQNIYDSVDGYLEKPSDEGNYAMKVGTGGYGSLVASNVVRGRVQRRRRGDDPVHHPLRALTAVGSSKENAFRRIRVEVALPNVKIRTRTGYFPENAQERDSIS